MAVGVDTDRDHGMNVAGGRDHRDEGLLGPTAPFEEPVREVAAGPELGDGEFDGSGPGVPLAWAVAVAGVDSLVADLAVCGVLTSDDTSADRRRQRGKGCCCGMASVSWRGAA